MSVPFSQAQYPALYLYPINDSFVPKHITLLQSQRVKIGRQTNAKTGPGERNGYFDSKVLSRQHAEIWSEGGKIYIRDVKSSNGTFVNGERLSPEGIESDPYELKTHDIVEFGIDIMAEDNKTIVHHKVAARAFCVLTEQDLQTALREEQQRPHHGQPRDLQQQQAAPSSNLFNTAGSGFNFQGHNPNGPSPAQRRSASLQQQTLSNMNAPASLNISMGGMGGSMRNPGKSGLTFDHILSRLHGELQKSRETGAELHTLTGSIHEIQDTLGGAVHAQPPNGPLYPQNLPPVRVPPPPEPVPAPPAETKVPSAALTSLQTELNDTKALLASHVDKTRSWEEVFEQLKREVYALREMVDARDAHQSETEALNDGRSEFEMEDPELFSERHQPEDEESDSDDNQSIHTIMGRELDRVDEEDETETEHEIETDTLVNGEVDTDEDAEDSFENRQRRREELGRPRTPGLGLLREDDSYDKDFSDATKNKNKNKIIENEPESPSATTLALDALTTRLSALSAQLQSAIAISSTMQAQHAAAQSTIEVLEAKVVMLEELVQKSATVEVEAEPEPEVVSEVSTETLAAEQTAQQLEDIRREDELNAFKSTLETQFSALRAEWAAERAELLATAQNEAKAVEERVAKKVEEALSTARAVEAQQKLRERELLQEKEQQQEREIRMNGKAQVAWLPTPPSSRGYSSDAELKSVVTAINDEDEEEATEEEETKNQIVKMPDSPVSIEADRSLESEPPIKHQHQPNGVGIDARPAVGTYHATTIIGVLVISIVTASVLWRVKPE